MTPNRPDDKSDSTPTAAQTDPRAVTVGTAQRLREIQSRTSDADLAELADEVAAIEDRLLYCESALHHICDHLGILPHALPDPMRPRLHIPPVDESEVSR